MAKESATGKSADSANSKSTASFNDVQWQYEPILYWLSDSCTQI